jgi:hypothetical protein
MFELTGLGRIKGCTESGLLFPLFSIRTSNYTFIHELNRSYSIQSFRKCDMEYFDFVPHTHRGNFVEGSAGLIAFESGPSATFLGTQTELLSWWLLHSDTVPENGLLHAILTEIVSDDTIKKYSAWRGYINHSFRGVASTSETPEVKLAQFQDLNKLWADLENERQSAEQEDQEFITNLFRGEKQDLVNWLVGNCSSHLWRRVWERADRYLLESSESCEIIYIYIEYCLVEIPSELHGNMSYLMRRAMSSEMLKNAGESGIEMLREFLELGVALLKRVAVLPGEFREYCIRLYREIPGPLNSALVLMIKSVTRLYDAEDNVGTMIDFRVVEVALSLLAEGDRKFIIEELMALVDFLFYVFSFRKRVEGLAGCIRAFDRLMQPYGINSSAIREAVNASRSRDYLYEMITMTGTA